MDLQSTPKSNRLHIGFYGRRNAGKSSLINLMTGQNTALVSRYGGTTTDPVIKSMELLPLGPIAVIDTAGFDDEGELGLLRVSKSKEMMDRTDLALLVISAESVADISFERRWLEELKLRKIPVLGILNQIDRLDCACRSSVKTKLESVLGIEFLALSALDSQNRAELLSAVIKHAPCDFESASLIGDLLPPNSIVLLVMPQDIQAPKGRLILPQVQVIRDILDNNGLVFSATAENLPLMLSSLKEKPALVITDSQIFAYVNSVVPRDIPLTSFSIIMARNKGDLSAFVKGARAIENLKENDRILIAEACTHAPLTEDIGREKIPRWLKEKVGAGLSVDIAAGIDFPKNIEDYSLIIHCGGCMFTRKQLMSRLIRAEAAGVPITNYGVAVAAINGILDRVTEIFPEIK